MPSSDFFSTNGPLALLIGVGFAIVQQVFKFVWRLAQVERATESNTDEIRRVDEEAIDRHEKLEAQLECLPRIEIKVEQLIEERRNVIRSSAAV